MNFEPEVAVVMGHIAKNVSVENAMDYVLGSTCVDDVTSARSAGHRPHVDASQGLRYLLPAWPVDRDA